LPFSKGKKEVFYILGDMARRKHWGLSLLLGAATIGAVGLPYSDFYRERRLASLSLAQLVAEQQNKQNDPLYLYFLGRRLIEQGEHEKAAPVLEQAVGLNPQSSRTRDAWAQAQLGSGRVSEAFGQLKQFAGTNPQSAGFASHH
jgi:tetratricopeptide (TPR) repeat protein